jgi:TonB family protein
MVPSSVFESADVWSLGTTLVEVLTQKLPVRQDTLQIDPLFPQDLSEPFLEIVRRSLRLDPTRRWNIAGIAAHLNLKPALAAAAGASPSPIAAASTTSSPAISTPPPPPLAVPLSRVAPLPASKLPEPKSYSIPPAAPRTSRSSSSGARFVFPAIAAVLFFAALFALPRFLSHKSDTSASLAPSESLRSVAPATAPKSDAKPAPPKSTASSTHQSPLSAAASAAPPVQRASAKERLDHTASAPPPQPSVVTPYPTAAKVSVSTPSSTSGVSSPARGEVLDQILPPVSDKARATIHGKVRVAVKVHVDASGNVSEAEFDSPGPSKYFADLALQAARKWEFSSPELDGHSVPSVWRIRFEFTSSDTKAYPSQETP